MKKKEYKKVRITFFAENRCVFCGAIIPEGQQVCPNCEVGVICASSNT